MTRAIELDQTWPAPKFLRASGQQPERAHLTLGQQQAIERVGMTLTLNNCFPNSNGTYFRCGVVSARRLK